MAENDISNLLANLISLSDRSLFLVFSGNPLINPARVARKTRMKGKVRKAIKVPKLNNKIGGEPPTRGPVTGDFSETDQMLTEEEGDTGRTEAVIVVVLEG